MVGPVDTATLPGLAEPPAAAPPPNLGPIAKHAESVPTDDTGAATPPAPTAPAAIDQVQKPTVASPAQPEPTDTNVPRVPPEGQQGRKLGRALATLFTARDDESIAQFRKHNLGKANKLSDEDLGRVREILFALSHALELGDDTVCNRLQVAWGLLWKEPRERGSD